MNFSAIISSKHGFRRKFVTKLAKHFGDKCKIYGRGWDQKTLGKSYKGEVEPLKKYKILDSSRYSLCIENSQQPNYFTEKITDCILSLCIPIYWGCPNISNYLPKDSYYIIDIKSPNVLTDISKIVNRPITAQNITALYKARDLILHKYNTICAIDSYITTIPEKTSLKDQDS